MSDLTPIPALRRDLVAAAADSQVGGLVVDVGDVMARAGRGRVRRRCGARRLPAVLMAAVCAVFLLVTLIDPGWGRSPETLNDTTTPDVVHVDTRPVTSVPARPAYAEWRPS